MRTLSDSVVLVYTGRVCRRFQVATKDRVLVCNDVSQLLHLFQLAALYRLFDMGCSVYRMNSPESVSIMRA